MNQQEKTEFLENLRRRFPIKNPQEIKIKQEEKIEFWAGDRGVSIHNNLLNDRRHKAPLDDTHIRFEYGRGLPIMLTIPKCSCDEQKNPK